MVLRQWKVESSNGDGIILLSIGNVTHEMSFDCARKIGDALTRAAQYEGIEVAKKLGEFVNPKNVPQ